MLEEDDAALVARCRRGDGAAWELLVHRYQRLVYAIARRMRLDEHAAADVFQTVFARLIEHLPKIADPDRLQAWLVTTAKREALLVLRRSQRNVSMTRSSGVDGAADGDDAGAGEYDIADDALLPEEALSDLQQLNGLRRAMDRLEERCRTLLTLLFRDEDDKVPYDEIARRLGISVGSIGPMRARCLGKLRELVERPAKVAK